MAGNYPDKREQISGLAGNSKRDQVQNSEMKN
jgi:hypothetical protein